jgi:hypothetical protein
MDEPVSKAVQSQAVAADNLRVGRTVVTDREPAVAQTQAWRLVAAEVEQSGAARVQRSRI